MQTLYERDNCHPMKEFILPWIQIPLWISMSLALRNMAGAIYVSDVRRYFSDTVYLRRCTSSLSNIEGRGVVACLHVCHSYDWQIGLASIT